MIIRVYKRKDIWFWDFVTEEHPHSPLVVCASPRGRKLDAVKDAETFRKLFYSDIVRMEVTDYKHEG